MFSKEKFNHVLSIPNEVFYLKAINDDPISRKISQTEYDEIITESASTGYKLAKKYKEVMKKHGILDFLDNKNIEVVMENELDSGGPIYFGAYDTNGPITLFIGNIMKSETLIASENIEDLDIQLIVKIVLAHEAFHYFEDIESNLYSNNKEVLIWSLGPIKYRTKLICPSEIGAMAFAKELLDLKFNSNALNYLLYSGINEQTGENYYNKIVDIHNSLYM